MNPNLTDSELSMAGEVIASRMGLHFPGEKRAMLRRNLTSASKEFGFQDISRFIQWLLSTELSKDQIMVLASHLTISETYFWREPQVFSALTDHILPELIRSKSREWGAGSREQRKRSIRIWSAGCSTGEEAYSIAIAIHKTIEKIDDWNITILATDINPAALTKAEHGIYGNWSFRNCPDWLKKGYFNDLGDRRFEIIPAIKQMVTFNCHSLVEMSAISNTDTMDIIFCRNVLMYFTSEWISKISGELFNSLSENGWFVVSSSELSSQVFPQFTPVNFPGAVLYQKGKNGSSYSLPPVSFAEKEPQLLPIFSPLFALEESPLGFDVPIAPSALKHPQPEAEETIADKIFAIRMLADQGNLEEALSNCNKAIASDKLATSLYLLRASIFQELDRWSEAIASLKHAIYVDPDYIMGHFTLGNLFIRQGNIRNAKRHFANVIDILSRYANDDILPETEGLSVKYIREIIFANMETIRTK
jgi:chemotaxis protein methyltransferase CheR